jgi:cell wall-associated NlpC family hydrolase
MTNFPLDPRTTPAREDLAAEYLRGRVRAARYVAGVVKRIVAPIAALRRAPASDAALETEALYGETVTIYEEKDNWGWVQLERDSYVGYIEASALGVPTTATHRIDALRSFGYPGPSMKLPPRLALPFDARLEIASESGDFAVTPDGLHFWSRHLQLLGGEAKDFVAVAERFIGAPYLWGGRSPLGIDCSGLAQTALRAIGIAAPRDSDQQEGQLGAALAIQDSLEGLRRGDLVFWKGHVGIMRDARTLLHANGWHMLVVSEALRKARERTQEKAREPISSIRRLDI